jgi:hypothetical protein
MIQITIIRPTAKILYRSILLLISDKNQTPYMFPSLWLKQITDTDVFLKSLPLFSVPHSNAQH